MGGQGGICVEGPNDRQPHRSPGKVVFWGAGCGVWGGGWGGACLLPAGKNDR